MPRVGPNYTLPQPPFQPQTPIASAAMNSDLSDIADALTGSLARNGAGGMTAVLPLANDGFTFINDPDTGISRSGANTMSFECGNSEVMEMSPTGIDVTGDISASGAIHQSGFPLLPVGLGPLPWSGLTAPGGWILAYGQTLLRSAYPALWAFAQAEIAAGNTLYTNGDGSTTFTVPDMRGRLPAGKDNMGGSAANRLTSTTMTPNGETLGANGGAQTQTLVTDNLPAYTPSGTVSQPTGTVNGNGAITAFQGSVPSAVSPGSGIAVFANSQQGSLVISQPTFIGNAQGGTSTPVNKTQPTIITNYIIFAGV